MTREERKIKLMNAAAPHMTRRSFVKVYGKRNAHIWDRIDSTVDRRSIDPYRWPNSVELL